MKDEKFVTVEVVHGELTASVLKSHLECEGIPVFLQYETLGLVTPFTIDGMGEIKIKVPEQFAEEAKKILQQPPEDTLDAEQKQ